MGVRTRLRFLLCDSGVRVPCRLGPYLCRTSVRWSSGRLLFFWVAPLASHHSSCRRQSDETGVWLLEYCAAENKFDRFRRSLELISRFEFDFCRCGN